MKTISAAALAAMLLLAGPALAGENPYDAPDCGVAWDVLYPACPDADHSRVEWRENHPFAKGCLRERGSIRVSRLECFDR